MCFKGSGFQSEGSDPCALLFSSIARRAAVSFRLSLADCWPPLSRSLRPPSRLAAAGAEAAGAEAAGVEAPERAGEQAAAQAGEQAAAQAGEQAAAQAGEQAEAPECHATPSLARRFATTSRYAIPARSGTGSIISVSS